MEMAYNLRLTRRRTILFGPSGSGKSSLLKLLIGFFTPDQGEIHIRNRVIFDSNQSVNIPIHHRQLGYLPQDYSLFPHLTVRDNILYGLKAQKIVCEDERFRQIVNRLGVAEKLLSRPDELSGGQQQRVALARIMLIQPQGLLLDEPFNALDNQVRETLRDLVIDLTDELDIPALLVTHDIEEALVFGQDIAVVADGQIIEYGRKEEIFQSPRFVETARLLDFQIWPVAAREGSELIIEGGEKFTCSSDRSKDCRYVCIRPENIMLVRDDRSLPEGRRANLVHGVVISMHNRAHYVRIVMRSIRGDYIIHAPSHVIDVMHIHKGKKIMISLKEEALILCESK